MIRNYTFNESGCMLKIHHQDLRIRNRIPPGNSHFPYQSTFEDDCSCPKVGNVSSLKGTNIWNKKGIFKTSEALQPHSVLHILSPF